MLSKRETLLCRYYYDPLDRLVHCTPSAQAITQRFYLKNRLTTEVQGVVQRSIMQHEDQLLAQQQHQSGAVETQLLATDQQRSVLNMLDRASSHPIAYMPYGHRPAENGLLSLLGFNGERPDPVTGHYLLGNGYRAFNPVLMRFNSPDSWSPFGKGGLNAYAYCVGDPVNNVDPNGRAPIFLKKLFRPSRPQLRASQTISPPNRQRSSESDSSMASSNSREVTRESSYIKNLNRNAKNDEIGMLEQEINKIYDEADTINNTLHQKLNKLNNEEYTHLKDLSTSKIGDLQIQITDLEYRYDELVGPNYADHAPPSFEEAVRNIRK